MNHLKYDPDKKSPLVINLLEAATGETHACSCFDERFSCKDLMEDPFQGLKYRYFNSWVLLEKISEVVLYYRPYCVVEIGAGESSIVLGMVTEKAGVEFHSVDLRPEKKCKYHRDHYYHNMASEKFMKTFTDNPAIVLIDGDHRYQPAKKEFDFFFEKLVPGGVIFLHDTLPPHEEFIRDNACGDVYMLRQELEKRTDEMDCLTFPYSAGYMGLTMVIKKKKERPYWEK